MAVTDPVVRWLPDFAPKTPDRLSPVPTIRHFLTHTAGMSCGFYDSLALLDRDGRVGCDPLDVAIHTDLLTFRRKAPTGVDAVCEIAAPVRRLASRRGDRSGVPSASASQSHLSRSVMRSNFTTFVVFSAMAIQVVQANASEDPTLVADRLLAQAKAATGGAAWDRLRTIRETGSFSGSGVSGSYTTLTDLRRVLSVQRSDAGAMSSSQGWDGKAAWSADASGQARVEESQQAIAGGIAQAYRSAYAFLWPARWPMTRTYSGRKLADGRSFDVVLITPRGADAFELWLDSATHRVVREVDVGGAQPHTLILSDFRRFNGVLLPRSTRDTIGDAQYDMVTTTTGLSAADAKPAEFGPPAPPVEAEAFPRGEHRIAIPLRLVNNHVYIDAQINGAAPQAFLFDTGATAMLDNDAAARLGIKPEGNIATAGFGEATATIGFAKVKSLAVGGFRLVDPVVMTMSMAGMSRSEGITDAGLLGYEIPKRAVVAIDYAGATMTLTRPSDFTAPAGSIAIPFKFDAHIPVIEATIDGIQGEFQVDTGSSAGILLMGPFAKAHELAARLHATRKVVAGQGVGGISEALIGRAQEFRIGGLVIERPVAVIQDDTRGAGAQSMIAGNIGGALLRRFTVTFDYAHKLIYLEPNAAFATPDVFDRSGLRLNREPDGSEVVIYLTTASAADIAGLHVGDRVVAVDGIPSREVSLSDLRDRFKGAPGTQFKLRIVRGTDAERDVVLTLADIA